MYTYPDGLLFWTRGPHSTDSKDWKDRANFITDYFFTHVQAHNRPSHLNLYPNLYPNPNP